MKLWWKCVLEIMVNLAMCVKSLRTIVVIWILKSHPTITAVTRLKITSLLTLNEVTHPQLIQYRLDYILILNKARFKVGKV